MDYTYFAAGPNQAFHHPYGALPPQPARVHEQLAGDVPTIFDSNFIYDAFPFDPHTSAANGQATTVTSAAASRFPTIPPPLPLPTSHNEPPRPAVTAAPPPPQPVNLNGSIDQQYANAQVLFEHSPSEVSSARTAEGSGSVPLADDLPADEPNRGRSSSSEEKDAANLTPAQSRRKAQNRAAQRAFRERKERRVRDLEEELNQYKQNYASLMEDNESLKRRMAKIATENEILRATAHVKSNDNTHAAEPIKTGPLRYAPVDYVSVPAKSSPKAASNGTNTEDGVDRDNGKTDVKKAAPITHRIKVSEKTGEKLLDAAAAWDVIVTALADLTVSVDVQDIYDRLKGRTTCDGTGPVIEEADVRRAIDETVAAAKAAL